MNASEQRAPGGPGVPSTWTASAKTGVGTALDRRSPVWFTLGQGILDEVYYPSPDRPCIRDLGFIVTDRADFFSEEKRDTDSKVRYLRPGVPAFQLTNRCRRGHYRLEKTVLSHPFRPVVLQQTHFVPERGGVQDYALFVLLAPHLGDLGGGNTAWIGEYKGVQCLFAERDDCALALACSAPWKARSAGFLGASDGWHDLKQHRRLTACYDRAENGNVALAGEVDLAAGEPFLLALAFGERPAEAGRHARAALLEGLETAQQAYVHEWEDWQRQGTALPVEGRRDPDLYPTSLAVIRCHESKSLEGGIIASLAIPWGFAHGDADRGGYHLVWPRDLVESAGALLAGGFPSDARRVLFNLQVTQEKDGHWAQNMWLDGEAYWKGTQLDETALAVLLVDLAQREHALDADDVARFWPMVRDAAGFLVRNGPVSPEDRWEEDAGYSPFTLAAEVAALLAAADLADRQGEKETAVYLRETADAWNDGIDGWMYARDTELARRVGVEGYYVRIAPPGQTDGRVHGTIPVRNRAQPEQMPAAQMVSPDALALVRFGLRAADDPRIANTVRVVDAVLKVDLPAGPAWHRYNDDGYGEHADGAPFDGTGVGRAWPLFSGERGHYELAAGRTDEARRLLVGVEGFANESGLIPEQVWDAADIPARGLYRGRPSGSAMPLVWAHAEYVKLRRSLFDKRVFDMPPQTVRRYLMDGVHSKLAVWKFNHKIRSLPAGKALRIETLAPGTLHWSADAWRTRRDLPLQSTGLGVWKVNLPTERLAPGARVLFTFQWQEGRWEGRDFEIEVTSANRPVGGQASGR